MGELSNVAVYLAAAVLSVALVKRLGFAAVLGYLLAGIAIGPWGLRLIEDVDSARHLSEFGVVLLLFVIGLELQPARLWALRRPVFGMGTAQVILTGCVLAASVWLLGLGIGAAVVIGFGLAMSSTAFVLQMLAEKHELGTAHGRAGFAILLMQDIAVIPLLAAVPLLAQRPELNEAMPLLGVVKVTAAIALLFPLSRFLIRPAFLVVARTEIPELFTALALLIVIGTTLLMEVAGISVTLGAFLAGVLLADSEFRHEIETRLAPFEGLLLGLFFIAVGMSANLGLLESHPFTVACCVTGLMFIKFVCVNVVARSLGKGKSDSLRLAAALCQGGEFAFILFALAREHALLNGAVSDMLMLVVSLSMALTPLVYAISARVARRMETDSTPPPPEPIRDTDHKVVIAGLGRFGQIVGRILRGLDIPFTALEINPEHIEMARRFGTKAYYGDASNLDLLRSARLENAQVIVIAIDDPDASVRTAALVKQHFPDVLIMARGRDRQHVYRLFDLGVTHVERELLHSSLHLTEQLLLALGMSVQGTRRAISAFRRNDLEALKKAHVVYKDEAHLIQTAKEAAEELRSVMEADRKLGDARDT